jgi:hypothetical protein
MIRYHYVSDCGKRVRLNSKMSWNINILIHDSLPPLNHKHHSGALGEIITCIVLIYLSSSRRVDIKGGCLDAAISHRRNPLASSAVALDANLTRRKIEQYHVHTSAL